MAKVFVIDVARCSGCHNCQLSCKDEHCENDWRPYAVPQPPTGQFWCRVNEQVRGTIPKVKIHYLPQLCNHCRNPKCLDVCPVRAIYRREDGLILINPDACIGCRGCVGACPYGSIYFNEKLHISQKCTGCAHLLDNGHSKPRCVEACPTDALRFGEESELAELLNDAVTLRPETNCAPRVYYRNIPGRFIGGLVYDPVEQEVLIGACCVLTGSDGERVTDTDDFGDFWFKNLPEAVYTLTISADGYRPLRFEGLDTHEDLNLGELPMERA